MYLSAFPRQVPFLVQGKVSSPLLSSFLIHSVARPSVLHYGGGPSASLPEGL